MGKRGPSSSLTVDCDPESSILPDRADCDIISSPVYDTRRAEWQLEARVIGILTSRQMVEGLLPLTIDTLSVIKRLIKPFK